MTQTGKATPFLWFDTQAEDAATYYVSLLPDSRVTDVQRQGPDGPAFLVTFELDGRPYIALNGGPHHKHSEAFSIYVACDSQDEIDRLWQALTKDGGEPGRCGWLKDRYGLSWQIVPKLFPELMAKGTPQQSQAVMGAMMQMTKFDMTALQKAFDTAA